MVAFAPLMVTTVAWSGPVADSPYPEVPTPLYETARGSARQITGRAPRVLILGDSIADQHGSHAALALREAGVTVRLATQWGASLFSRDQYDRGASVPNPPPGSLLAQATRSVVGFNPDVVAVYINHNYWPPYPRDASGREIAYGSPEFRAMAQTQLRELHGRLSQNGAKVYLVEPFPFEGFPPGENPIWTSYLSLQDELGFGVIRSGRILTTTDGRMVGDLADCAGRPTGSRPAGDTHLSYFGAGLMGTVTARALAADIDLELLGATAPTEPPAALVPAGLGYRVVTCDGATFGFTDVGPHLAGVGLAGGRTNGDPVVAATTTAFGRQGWAVSRSGMVFPLGSADELGHARMPGEGVVAVGIASVPQAQGYWVATSDGGVQAFGEADALGDLAEQGQGVVAMASTPDRRGYWLLTASGRVEGFGSARHFGDVRAAPPSAGLVAMAAHPSGEGYWLLDRAGNVYPFGVARDLGSAAHQDMVRVVSWRGEHDYDLEPVPASAQPTYAVSLLPSLSGEGYWIALGNGAVCHFGDALVFGGLHIVDVQSVQAFLQVPHYREGACSSRPKSDTGAAGPAALRRLALLG